jgi:2-keto-4-pentenoate hydratase/2-oxohepta-3-ene-1,7-dioic acid hydratase in catechol pathway
MRLYSYQLNEEVKVGAERDGRLVALPFKDMLELIQGGSKALDLAQKELRVATASRDLDEVELLAPIPRPGKIFCSGLNYRGHLAENPRASLLADPRFFVKVSDAVIAHGKEIIVPPEPFQVDYEVELAVIIDLE